jgi:hypothetical protein
MKQKNLRIITCLAVVLLTGGLFAQAKSLSIET